MQTKLYHAIIILIERDGFFAIGGEQMGFFAWFSMWVRSFHRLLTYGGRRRLSARQRERARARRIKARQRPYGSFKKGRGRGGRKSGSGSGKFAAAILGFVAATLAVALLPFGLFHWGYKSAQVRRGSRSGAGSRKKANGGEKRKSPSNAVKKVASKTGVARKTPNAAAT